MLSALQWEQIEAVGTGPAPRYSHSLAKFESAQNVVFLYGGYDHMLGFLSDFVFIPDLAYLLLL